MLGADSSHWTLFKKMEIEAIKTTHVSASAKKHLRMEGDWDHKIRQVSTQQKASRTPSIVWSTQIHQLSSQPLRSSGCQGALKLLVGSRWVPSNRTKSTDLTYLIISNLNILNPIMKTQAPGQKNLVNHHGLRPPRSPTVSSFSRRATSASARCSLAKWRRCSCLRAWGKWHDFIKRMYSINMYKHQRSPKIHQMYLSMNHLWTVSKPPAPRPSPSLDGVEPLSCQMGMGQNRWKNGCSSS